MEFKPLFGSGSRRYKERTFGRFCSIFYICLAMCGVVAWGCAASRSPGISSNEKLSEPSNESAIAAKSTISSSAVVPEYRIGLLDELEIRVRYHDRLNETSKVRPDGRITLEDLGDIYVLGMTPSELDRYISTAYSQFIHAPEVTVFVRNFASVSVYVFGEVQKPGIVEMKPNMTALQAIAAASGPIRGAKMNSVILLRRNTTGELAGTRLNLNRASIAEAAYEDYYVHPEDVIYVPKTFIANVSEFLNQIYAIVFPPFDIYLRALREYNRAAP